MNIDHSLNSSNSSINIDARSVARAAKNTMEHIEQERKNMIKRSVREVRTVQWKKSWPFRKRLPYFKVLAEESSESSFWYGHQYEVISGILKIAENYHGEMTLSIQDALRINLK